MAKLLLVEDNERNRDMLSRRLEAAADTKGIPVIALTAHAMSSDEQKPREAGCDDYGTKAIEVERLVAKHQALPGASNS